MYPNILSTHLCTYITSVLLEMALVYERERVCVRGALSGVCTQTERVCYGSDGFFCSFCPFCHGHTRPFPFAFFFILLCPSITNLHIDNNMIPLRPFLSSRHYYSSTSSKWFREHVSDSYVRRSKADGYRARSAYKLIQMDEKYRLLRPDKNCVVSERKENE